MEMEHHMTVQLGRVLVLCTAFLAVAASDSVVLENIGAWAGLRGPHAPVTVGGQQYLIGGGMNTLSVLSVDDPAAVTQVGSVLLKGGPCALAIRDTIAYLGIYYYGVQIVDFSTPSRPVVVGECAADDGARECAVSGEYAYVVGTQSSLAVVDISVPYAPQVLGELTVSYAQPSCVVVLGQYLYVISGSYLTITDVSDPHAPVAVGAGVYVGRSVDMVAIADYLYVARDLNGPLLVLNVSDPAQPVIADSLETVSGVEAICPSGSFAYIVDASAVHVLDVSDPGVPAVLGSCQMWPYSYGYGGHALSARGTQLYWTCSDDPREGALIILDISDPASPESLAVYPRVDARQVVVGDGYAWVHGYEQRVVCSEVKEPSRSLKVSEYESSAPVTDMTLGDPDRLYLAIEGGGFEILDVSDPQYPVLLGLYDSTRGTIRHQCIALSGDHVLLALGGRALLDVVDVSDAARPVRVGQCPLLSDWPTDMALAGEYLYVAYYDTSLCVFDVSDKANPSLVAVVDTLRPRRRVEVSGDRAYVNGGEGWCVLDISVPQDPTLLHTHHSVGPGFVSAFTLHGDLLYVNNLYVNTGGNCTLQVYDNSLPENPVLIAQTYVYGNGMSDVVVKDGRIYVANAALEVFELVPVAVIPRSVRPVRPSRTAATMTCEQGRICYQLPQNSLAVLSLFTAAGRKAFTDKRISGGGCAQQVILPRLAPGVYTVQLLSGARLAADDRFVVVR
jgi:hypothetical protein